MIGKRLGQYEIVEEVGRGGMGIVYRARQASLNRDVAVKVLQADRTFSAQTLERFRREAAVVAQVAHPNIVQILDVGEQDGQHYIAMEFVRGDTLARRLQQKGAMSARAAVQVAAQIAGALGAIHARGFVHRDVKPSNILADDEFNAKLTDFGVAQLTDQPEAERLTMARMSVGTPQYMSPEQVLSRERLDGSSDVYSLGVVLYEMLSGKHPWEEATANEAMIKQVHEPLPPIRRYCPTIPDDLEQMLNRCLEKDRSLRYPDGAALRKALNPILLRLEMEDVKAAAQPRTGEYQPRVTGTGFFYVDAGSGRGSALAGWLRELRHEIWVQIRYPHKKKRKALERLTAVTMGARDASHEADKHVRELQERRRHHEKEAARLREEVQKLIAEGRGGESAAAAEKESYHNDLALDYEHQARDLGKQAAERRATYDGLRAKLNRAADELALLDAEARRKGKPIPAAGRAKISGVARMVVGVLVAAVVVLLLWNGFAFLLVWGRMLLRSWSVPPRPKPPVPQAPVVQAPVKHWSECGSSADWTLGVLEGGPRANHAAVLLRNGLVLLAAGRSGPDAHLGSAVLYDPAKGTYKPTGSLATPRHDPTFTLLPDGRVLLVGGYNRASQWLTDAEIYDPRTETWKRVPPLHPHGVRHTATLLKDGKVLVVAGAFASGWPGHSDRAELFDPATDTWRETAPIPGRRGGHLATLLDDGRVLVAGGCEASSPAAVIYDPAGERWTPVSAPVNNRSMAVAIRLADGRVLVTGGHSAAGGPLPKPYAACEIFDPKSGLWKTAASLGVASEEHTLTLLPDGRVLLVGGTSEYDMKAPLCRTEIYDPRADTWTPGEPLHEPRCQHSATPLPDGRLFVAGGDRYSAALTSTETLIPPGAAKAKPVKPLPLEKGLVLYLPFDRNEGAKVTDRSGQGNHGEVLNASHTSQGMLGGAYEFTGQASEIRIPDSASLNPAAEITIAAWIKPMGPGFGNGIVMLKGPRRSNTAQYGLVFFPDNQQGVQGRMSFGLHTTGNGRWDDHFGAPAVVRGAWTHVAGTYRSGELNIYINGEKAEETRRITGPIVSRGGDLFIGSEHSFPNDEYFKGRIDEVRIYNRALSAGEIAELYKYDGR